MKSKWLSLVLHPWKCGFAHLCTLEAVAIITFWACTDQVSRKFTNILQLLEAFQRVISRFGTKWPRHINLSLLKSRKHLNISATFYLASSALCIVQWHSDPADTQVWYDTVTQWTHRSDMTQQLILHTGHCGVHHWGQPQGHHLLGLQGGHYHNEPADLVDCDYPDDS